MTYSIVLCSTDNFILMLIKLDDINIDAIDNIILVKHGSNDMMIVMEKKKKKNSYHGGRWREMEGDALNGKI